MEVVFGLKGGNLGWLWFFFIEYTYEILKIKNINIKNYTMFCYNNWSLKNFLIRTKKGLRRANKTRLNKLNLI